MENDDVISNGEGTGGAAAAAGEKTEEEVDGG